VAQIDFEIGSEVGSYEFPKLVFPGFNSTLTFHRCNMFMLEHEHNGTTELEARLCFTHALEAPCPDILVLQTGNWYGLARGFPRDYASILEQSMSAIRMRCPRTRAIWMPPSLPHGGIEDALKPQSTSAAGHGCHTVKQLVNASVFHRMLAMSTRGSKRARIFAAGKNANRNELHRRHLLQFAQGGLEVVDVSLAGQARADGHFDPKDNCGHWVRRPRVTDPCLSVPSDAALFSRVLCASVPQCLPGPPDTFASLLVAQLCSGLDDGDELPDPRTCVAV
jgi:hypothetical protein